MDSSFLLLLPNALSENGCFVYTIHSVVSLNEPLFIKVTPENPVLWTGMKGVSAKGRKNN
jgi:hypothetical protein